jgi:hypothetical protein
MKTPQNARRTALANAREQVAAQKGLYKQLAQYSDPLFFGGVGDWNFVTPSRQTVQ